MSEYKVGDTVFVKPFDDAGGLLKREHAAFKAVDWQGSIIEYREWMRGNKWLVRAGNQTIWCRADELTLATPQPDAGERGGE